MVQKKFQPKMTKPGKMKSEHGRYYITYFEGKGATYTYNEIKKFAQEKSNQLKKINNEGRIQVTLKFEGNIYRSSGMVDQGDQIKLWSPQDSDIDGEFNDNIIGFTLTYSLK